MITNFYYNSIILSKGVCRRCKKPGHYEKWCVEDVAEPKVTCRFCLGDHYFLKCPKSLCFKCNQFGHMAKDCDVEGFKCHRCNKKGHKSKDYDENIFEKDKQRLKDLLCINCQERGHLNCFSKGYKKYDLLYCEGKEQREREKMNRIEHSSKDKHSHQHNHQHNHTHHHQNKHQHTHQNQHHQHQHQHQHSYQHSYQHQHQHNEKNLKEQTQYLPHKTTKSIQKQKYHQQDSSSQYSIWSEESPDTKRMNNTIN